MLIVLRNAIKADQASKLLDDFFKDNTDARLAGEIEYEKHHMQNLYNCLKDIDIDIFPGGLKELDNQVMSRRQIIIPIKEKTINKDKYIVYPIFLFIEVAVIPNNLCSCNREKEKKVVLRVQYRSKFKNM